MHYLTQAAEIQTQIAKFTLAKVLWLDTEVANWNTPYPKLSLIQILAEPTDSTGKFAYIFDVLNKPDLIALFIQQIMVNSQIEKVFHNASFDLKYLGEKSAQNITCTLKLARKITLKKLQTSNLKLKTLAAELCQFSHVDSEEGRSDWGKRPLSEKQLHYAAMDTVYLAAVHRRLLEIDSPNFVTNIFNIMPDDSKNISLTATKVRVAFECPRLFYLHQKFGGNTLFIPQNNQIGIGNSFHNLADSFIKLAVSESRFTEIFKTSTSQLNIEEIASLLQQLFYEIKFSTYLEKAIEQDASAAQPLYKVWQGLQGLIRRFAELLVINRRYCSAEEVIPNTFVSQERKLEHYFQLPDRTQQRVGGEFDCLVYNFEVKRLCVLEFKTYQPVDPSAQLAQVALYSYMLWHQKKVAVDSAVYCVLPEFKEYQYSWEQLENNVHQLIPYKLHQMQQWLSWEPPHPNSPPRTTQPYLCEICPQEQKCQTFFVSPSLSFKDKNNGGKDVQPTRTNSVNADAIGEELVTTLQSFGISVDYHGAAVGPAFIRVKLKPHLGVKVNALLKLSADLQVQMGLANPPLIAPQAGYVSVDLPRPNRQIASFEEYVQPQFLPPTVPIKIAIGLNIEGELVEADLSDANTCHFLVGGTTGSGKSEFLRSLLLSLLNRHSPEYLKIALVDPKRVTFPEFEKMPWLYSPVVKDGASAIELMDELVAEMESRYHHFEKAGCADLSTYNQRSAKILPRIVCIFDEYADFMAEKEIRTSLEQSIKRLGAMARAAGIHLIIATQRPEAKVVTPIIRSNLPGRVALRTASEADSAIVLGGKQTAAAYLLGKGDLLYQIGAQMHRLQSLFVKNIQLPSI
ncbi:cell division protein FtsK [Nostoc linckia z18]|uniref:Cell division protein FtsK n=2 Tax=Nostoc linckia TaxID=92942 RepID=A0A9Q6EHP1_NOSLI|nr:DNA translocase FtsK [Nostoc linckia]PHK31556.1 cell division protein FtsK [Nostoc linckia z15]PHK43019.1 cell division protein FtsK [Nostoc linckia z16]PHJ57550.1 cell division protein FtsK [Nostoc linckia z1]PHJ59754.1 cell division protein FtsK [Nostoc linckia z3]PHJ64522.1 cell division protein FtsK [Nostoc linckia z2]